MKKALHNLFARHIDEDEEIVSIVHKHWLVGLKFLFWPAVCFLLCWYALYLAPFLAIFYAVCLCALVCAVWFLRNFFDYYLDAWIVTDQGIIDVEWHGWFHRESTRVLYSDIQGVSHEVQGVLPTVFRLGTVSIEKISTGNAISIDYVKFPIQIEKLILKRMETYMHTKNMHDSSHVQEILSEIVSREIRVREEFPQAEEDESDEDEWLSDGEEEDDEDDWDDDWEDEEEDDDDSKQAA